MSTIVISNIKATGETASRAVSGVAAAYLSFITDPFTIYDSLNSSSEVDNGSGDLTYNLTNFMANANYAHCGEGGGEFASFYSRIPSHHGSTASSVRVRFTNSGTYSTGDVYDGSSTIHGDLA